MTRSALGQNYYLCMLSHYRDDVISRLLLALLSFALLSMALKHSINRHPSLILGLYQRHSASHAFPVPFRGVLSG